MSKKIIVLLLVLGLIAAAWWLVRPHYRLPFDQVSPFQAVSMNSSVLIGLPNLATATDLNNQQLWYLDAKRVKELLDTLSLDESVSWQDWWLLPEVGDGPQDAVYTFIGSASNGLGSAWSPKDYGPTLAFGDGDIYTFGISSDDPVYYARYHNVFVAGRYPFQIENALLSLKGEMETWPNDEQFEALLPKLKKWPEEGEKLILRTNALKDKVPANWLSANDIREYEAIADWVALHFTATDSMVSAEGVIINDATSWSAYGENTDWDKVPEIVNRLYPLSRKNQRGEDVSDPFEEWLGNGGWQMELESQTNQARIAPQLWVLPIGDTTAYLHFRDEYLSADQYLEESTYQLFDLYQLRTASSFTTLTERKAWQPWIVELPDALLVSVFREDIERYLDYYLLGASLNKEEHFLELVREIELGDGPKGFYRWGPLADKETNWFRLLYPQFAWSHNGMMFYQAESEGENLWGIRGVIKESPVKKQAANLGWTAELPVQEGLTLLPVHSLDETLPQNFMVQATNGDCWLLDNNGQILWSKRSLPTFFSPLWKVRLLDGKTNYLATSQERLHLWEADGTVKKIGHLTATPSAAPTIISFDQVSNPQLIFPTQEGTLEMLHWDGTSAQGWPAKLSGRPVTNIPVTHWQLPEEDLIIAWGGIESWQFFDRYGRFTSSFPPVPEAPLGLPGLELNTENHTASRLLIATATGKINVWDMDGNIFPIPLGRGPVDNFLFSNLWGDGRGDYIAQRGALVHLFAYDNAAFKERWQQRLSFTPDALLPAEPLGLIAVQKSPDQLWLINGQGEIATGFPLSGEGQAILSSNAQGGYQLITIVRGEVYAYELSDLDQ